MLMKRSGKNIMAFDKDFMGIAIESYLKVTVFLMNW